MNQCTGTDPPGGICLRLDQEHTDALKSLLEFAENFLPSASKRHLLLLADIQELVNNPED